MREYYLVEKSSSGTDINDIVWRVMFILFALGIIKAIRTGNSGDTDVTEVFTYYEAEAEENTFGGETISMSSSVCSGEVKVSYIGNDDSSVLTFNGIEVNEGGSYEVALFYCCDEDRTVYYSVNENDPIYLNTPQTGDIERMGIVTFTIQLEEGTNSISFGNSTSYAPDIDRIGVIYLSETDDVETEMHYYNYYDVDCTWEEASAMCEELGGHLVTITSEREQEIVKYLLGAGGRNSYWLGGYRLDESFYWVTGEDFSYSNWASGQPDNYTDSNENAIMMYRETNPDATDGVWGTWNDLNSNGTCDDSEFFGTENMGFICEKEV